MKQLPYYDLNEVNFDDGKVKQSLESSSRVLRKGGGGGGGKGSFKINNKSERGFK